MILIDPDAGFITQINLFTVPPGGQKPLLEHLTQAIQCAREERGWLSSSLHRSLDGTRVANYAQSEDLKSAEAVISRLRRHGFIDRNQEFGEAHPGLYEVVASFSR